MPLASARQHPENQKENQAGHSSERTVEGRASGVFSYILDGAFKKQISHNKDFAEWPIGHPAREISLCMRPKPSQTKAQPRCAEYYAKPAGARAHPNLLHFTSVGVRFIFRFVGCHSRELHVEPPHAPCPMTPCHTWRTPTYTMLRVGPPSWAFELELEPAFKRNQFETIHQYWARPPPIQTVVIRAQRHSTFR